MLGRTHENGARYLTIERDAPRAFLSRAPLVGERDLVLEGSAAIPGETPCLLTQREKPCASTFLSLVGPPGRQEERGGELSLPTPPQAEI